MANEHYKPTFTFTPDTVAVGEQIVFEHDAIEGAFDGIPTKSQLASGSPNHVVAGGTADAIVISAPQGAWTTYVGKDGYEFAFQVAENNTAAVTIDVDGLGAVQLNRSDGAALQAEDLVASGTINAVFNESAGSFYVKHSVPSYIFDHVANAPAASETGIVKATGVGFEGTVVDGDAVYWVAGNNHFAKAIADGTDAQELVGIADVTNSKTEMSGVMSSLRSGLTSGAVYYLSDSVAGSISTTKSAMRVGVARTTAALFINIEAVAREPSVDYQEFTSSGTWVKPANAISVYVEAVGAGSGGSNVVLAASTTIGAGGGGGGGWSAKTLDAAIVPSSVPVTIGGGGLGGAIGSANNGAEGGGSSFGSLVTGEGGGATTGRGGGQGRGRYLASSSGTILDNSHYDCGSGSAYARAAGDCVYGGAGGGGSENTTQRAGGVSQFDGNGGDGNDALNVVGGAGAQPGGGGGGTTNNGGGGDGGDGIVRVWSNLK